MMWASWQKFGKMSVYAYEYDHTGLRTAKTVDNETTEMITDGMYVVAEYTGTQSTYYYRGLNLMGYVSDDEISYYRFNAHGDVVAIVDGFGETLKTYKYDAFGKQEEDGNEWLKILFGVNVEDSNPFRYCAEYYDEETEFIYLRARYYSPKIQRFISEDPIKDGINWYAYCGNNAVNALDSIGLWPTWNDVTDGIFNITSDCLDWGSEVVKHIGGLLKDSSMKAVDFLKAITRDGKIDWLLWLVLGAEKDKDGIYHIRQGWWQSIKYIGYNDFYDWVFDTATRATGTSMKSKKLDFVFNNQEYVIWFWKGDYIALGAGAEAGIYYGGEPHWLIDTKLAMPMTLELLDKDGNPLFYYAPDEDQWWITGFDPNHPNVQADELTAIYTLDFSNNKDMFDSFYARYGGGQYPGLTFNSETYTATFRF